MISLLPIDGLVSRRRDCYHMATKMIDMGMPRTSIIIIPR